jgi:hypothetical protein
MAALLENALLFPRSLIKSLQGILSNSSERGPLARMKAGCFIANSFSLVWVCQRLKSFMNAPWTMGVSA